MKKEDNVDETNLESAISFKNGTYKLTILFLTYLNCLFSARMCYRTQKW